MPKKKPEAIEAEIVTRKPKKKVGLDSVEASALLMSEGYTKDPMEATKYHDEFTPDIDAEMRAKLRESMGFDFKIKMQDRKRLIVTTKGHPRLRVQTFVNPADVDEYGNIISQALINRLVDACIALKAKWDVRMEEMGK